MFVKKIYEIFKELPNIFDIADDILIVEYNDNGTDINRPLHRELQICRKENLKLKKDKCNFRCTNIPFWAKITSSYGVNLVHVNSVCLKKCHH